MDDKLKKIIELSDGQTSSTEIAKVVGLSARYVRRLMKRHDLPRLNEGARRGS